MDGKGLSSQEGNTQGDPLAMAMCAIGISILLLIHHLNSDQQVEQMWYAHDAMAGGTLRG